MTDIKTTRLESLEIGAAPLVQALIDRLGLEELLTARSTQAQTRAAQRSWRQRRPCAS